MLNDLRYAIRMLLKSPAFTILAVMSLAIGIGVNASIFSALDATFLRPLPFKNPDEIVRFRWPMFSLTDYEQLRPSMRSLAGLSALSRHGTFFNGEDATELLTADYVTRNYFSVLGIHAAAGILFSEDDPFDRRNDSAVVISYGLWQRHFGGDTGIIGKTITLSRQPVIVLGVTAPGFTGSDRIPPCEVWYSADSPTLGADKISREFELIGRLRPGCTVQQAQSEAEVFLPATLANEPLDPGVPRVLVQSDSQLIRDSGGRVVLAVMAIAGLVLLVACANVSGLLMARYEQRRRELAVRMALGGGRLRLMRQLLIEGLLLSLLGACAALLLTSWAIRIIPAVVPPTMSSLTPELRVDHRVFALALGLACLASLIFTLLPAWRATRADLTPLLKGEVAPLVGAIRHLTPRNALVVAQLAVSLLFLAVSALLVRGLLSGMKTDLGFAPRNVLTVMFDPAISSQPNHFSRMQDALRAVPGVQSVSMAMRAPLSLSGGGLAMNVMPPGAAQRAVTDAQAQRVGCNIVEPGYFQTLGIRTLGGREFADTDDQGSEPVVIISDGMARRFWPGQNALGRTISAGFQDAPSRLRTIVGVVGDVSNLQISPDQSSEAYMYVPMRQESRGDLTLIVRTSVAPGAMIRSLRQALRQADPQIAILGVQTLDQLVRFQLLPQWVGAWLIGTLGVLAFVLAIGGMWGVMAYVVTRRTRELGIRLALGAGRGDAVWLVLRQAIFLGLGGVAIGIPLAIAAGFVLRSMLFGVSPADPSAIVGASILVVVVATAASYFPARRAARVDPMVALRAE